MTTATTDRPRILMCPPEHYGIEYEINPWMKRSHAADSARARGQWQRLYETLIGLGVTIELIEPVAGLPDLVFTANAGLVYGDRFLGSRFRHGVRRGESPRFESWFATHGFQVEHLPPDCYFEGAGDALFCGETLFAGYRIRSDARSHHWIGEHYGIEVLPLELVDPRFYHLDTCFCPLAEGQAIYVPGAFDEYGRSVLHGRIGRLIAVSEAEAVWFSCNAVVVGRTVVLNQGAPHLTRDLEAAGYDVVALELGEFLKSGGSAKCLTLRLDGEEAAAWKHAVPSHAARS
jgi:N-dimethylarginine dimethylaminohydrolase